MSNLYTPKQVAAIATYNRELNDKAAAEARAAEAPIAKLRATVEAVYEDADDLQRGGEWLVVADLDCNEAELVVLGRGADRKAAWAAAARRVKA